MRDVLPGKLWIGNARDARDLAAVHDRGIRAVIDLAAEEPPALLSRDIVYCRFPLLDGLGNPPWLLHAAIRTTAGLIRSGVPTLVACSGGMSRSPVVLAAALAAAGQGSLDECLRQCVNEGPRQVSPAFWQAVMETATDPSRTDVL